MQAPFSPLGLPWSCRWRPRCALSMIGKPGTLRIVGSIAWRRNVAALDFWHVPVSIRADVPTIESLAGGNTTGKAAVSELRAAFAAGDELLPTTLLPLDLGALVSAGLVGDVATGWRPVGPVGRVCWDRLPRPARGLFPEGSIRPPCLWWPGRAHPKWRCRTATCRRCRPLNVELTFSLPTEMVLDGRDVRVMGEDSELSARTAQASVPGQTALVANQILAELAMVDLEAPGDRRGIVLAPPPGTVLAPGFLAVMLAGLRANPLLKAVPLAQMFHDVPLAAQENGHPMLRQLEAPQMAPLGGADLLAHARGAVSADGELYGVGSPLVGGLNRELDVSLSAVFSSSQRGALMGTVLRAAQSYLSKVRLPPSISITLTSRQGRLPLTLLSSAGSPVKVRLGSRASS